jgi:septal ring factor EnvC (AmiA/AmiB activator)
MAWIDLAQFATKYGVSQSTLRRRIRANTINFRLERGKYFLDDSPSVLSEAPLFARNVNQPVSTAASQRALQSHQSIPEQTSDTIAIEEENRRLKKQLAELETFVSALEAEVRRLQELVNPQRNDFGVTESF